MLHTAVLASLRPNVSNVVYGRHNGLIFNVLVKCFSLVKHRASLDSDVTALITHSLQKMRQVLIGALLEHGTRPNSLRVVKYGQRVHNTRPKHQVLSCAKIR